jgi:hypothetical protein
MCTLNRVGKDPGVFFLSGAMQIQAPKWSQVRCRVRVIKHSNAGKLKNEFTITFTVYF